MSTTQSDNTRNKGAYFEEIARHYLGQFNLKHIQSNYFCRHGEIDLILFEKASNSLVFVEVKYRNSNRYGHALETISTTKQGRIKRCAAHYLHCNHKFRTLNCRFDAIAVTNVQSATDYSINWVQNAFY